MTRSEIKETGIKKKEQTDRKKTDGRTYRLDQGTNKNCLAGPSGFLRPWIIWDSWVTPVIRLDVCQPSRDFIDIIGYRRSHIQVCNMSEVIFTVWETIAPFTFHLSVCLFVCLCIKSIWLMLRYWVESFYCKRSMASPIENNQLRFTHG